MIIIKEKKFYLCQEYMTNLVPILNYVFLNYPY
jgi:hypothetical protein